MTSIAEATPRFGIRPRSGLILGAGITGAFVGIAILSQFWTPELPTRMHMMNKLKPPFEAGLAGTDAFGVTFSRC